MKAILVIEMPASCLACPLHDRSDYADWCMGVYRRHSDSKYLEEREEWCPLKPIPQKIEMDMNEYYEGVADGWNGCIDKIVGETE